MKNRWKVPIILFTAIIVLSFAGGLYISYLLFSPAQGKSSSEPVEFRIEKGERLDSISYRLHQQNLLIDPVALKLAAFFKGGSAGIKAGVHKLARGLNALELYEALQKSPPKEFIVLTIPEGWDSFEIAALVESKGIGSAKDFLAIVNDPSPVADLSPHATTLEGFLFPDTYHVPVDSQPADVVEMMLKRSRLIFNGELKEQIDASGLTPGQVVALASLIAKEAGNEEEMPLISSVFHNRLRLKMKLDCDPTFIYASKLAGEWDGKIDPKDKNRDSPYNTYLYAGLPPGAIGNPGENALKAAVNPKDSNYLYFVAKGPTREEGHYFSESFAQHQRAVNLYRKAMREARSGDSN